MRAHTHARTHTYARTHARTHAQDEEGGGGGGGGGGGYEAWHYQLADSRRARKRQVQSLHLLKARAHDRIEPARRIAIRHRSRKQPVSTTIGFRVRINRRRRTAS